MHPNHYELDAALAETHWWWAARRVIIAHLIDRLIDPKPGRHVLEIGCSTGSNFAMLQRYGDLEAMELFTPAAEHCRRRYPEIPVHNQGIPNDRADTYDMICLFDVLEHIEDDAGALAWIDDHLNANGMVFITVPAFAFLWSRHDELAHHHRRYRRDGLLSLVRRNFDISYSTYFNTHLFPAIAGVRLLQRLGGLPQGAHDKAIAGQGVVNALLRATFGAERLWLPSLSLPFGVSIFVAAEKRPAG